MTVQISGLPTATSVADTDFLIVRQGLVDRKAQVNLVKALKIADFSLLSIAQQDDVMVIARGTSNYKIEFKNVGLLSGTVCWFYQSSAPMGWTPVANTNDCLLAVKSTSGTYTNAGTIQGTWLQPGHTLTIDEIPPHTHGIRVYSADGGGQAVRSNNPTGQSNLIQSQSTGGGQSHTHGDTWRPLSAVGLLCRKD